MASRNRVFNESRCEYMNFAKAERAYFECSADWVEYPRRMRDLTVAEAMEARKNPERRKTNLVEMKMGLAWAELPNTRFEASSSGLVAHRRGWELVKQANEFVTSMAAA